jgi:hypothetical protein
MVRKARYLFLVAGVVLSFLLSVGTAAAQSTVWDAVKRVVPVNAIGVVRLNLAALRKTSPFATHFPTLLGKEPKVKEALQDIQRLCKIDVVGSVEDLVLVIQTGDKVGAFVKIQGVTQTKATACLASLARSKKDSLTAQKSGNIVEYSFKKSKDKYYVGWLTPDVAVIASDVANRDLLESMLQPSHESLLALEIERKLTSENINGLAWGATSYSAQITPVATMKGAYGAVGVAGGVMSIQARLRFSSANEASRAVTEFNRQIAQTITRLPPTLSRMAQGIRLGSVGDEMTIAISVSEADVGSVISFLLGS